MEAWSTSLLQMQVSKEAMAGGFPRGRDHMAEMENPKQVLIYIMQQKEEKKLKIICTLWTWWNERNRIREGKRRRTLGELSHGIHVYSMEILK